MIVCTDDFIKEKFYVDIQVKYIKAYFIHYEIHIT